MTSVLTEKDFFFFFYRFLSGNGTTEFVHQCFYLLELHYSQKVIWLIDKTFTGELMLT